MSKKGAKKKHVDNSTGDITKSKICKKDAKQKRVSAKNNPKTRRIIVMILTIVLNIIVVGFIAVKEIGKNAKEAQVISFADIKFLFLLAGVLCFGVAVFVEYLKYKDMIMMSEGHIDRAGAFNCSMLGKYYDNVTPFGAGGQPFQIHYLHQRGFSSGTSSAVPIAAFLMQQMAFVVIAIVVFIVNGPMLADIAVVRVVAFLGLAMYMLIPFAIIFFALLPKPFKRLIGGITGLLAKIHILKDGEKSAEKVFSLLDEYITSLKAMNKRPFFFVKIFIFSIIYQVAILSIPFFMLKAFGGAGDWFTVFSLTVYIYTSITVIPTPGNAGAAEVSFYAVFSSLEGGFLFWAMIIWRLLVYYSWIIIGIIIVTKSAVKNKKHLKKPVPHDRPLRVALFVDLFYPSIDGVVRVVDAYAKEINKSGGYACVFTPKASGKYKDTTEYDVIRTPSSRLFKFGVSIGLPIMSKKLTEIFKEKDFDVVHIHSPFGAGLIGVKLANKFNIPAFATFHSKYYDDALNITHNKTAASIVTNAVVDFFCQADVAWACSKNTAETLKSYGFKGEVGIMENGVDFLPTDDSEGMKNEAAETFGIPRDKRILLFVGQQIWQKNLKLVLDTSKAMKKERDDVITVIVGCGYNEGEIKKYAKKIDIDDRVIFTGKIADRRLLSGVYMLADLLFFPSLYDNAPLVLREAASVGLPALLVEGSNSAEVIEDGVNGYTAKDDVDAMKEKIVAAFSNDDIKSVGENAKNTIPKTWEEIVKKAIDGYREANV